MKKGKGEMELKRCKKLEPLSQILKQGEMELKRCKKLEPLSHQNRIRRDTEYLFVFSWNAGKCAPERLQIWTLFTQ